MDVSLRTPHPGSNHGESELGTRMGTTPAQSAHSPEGAPAQNSLLGQRPVHSSWQGMRSRLEEGEGRGGGGGERPSRQENSQSKGRSSLRHWSFQSSVGDLTPGEIGEAHRPANCNSGSGQEGQSKPHGGDGGAWLTPLEKQACHFRSRGCEFKPHIGH